MSTRGETPLGENDPPQPPTKSTALLLLGIIGDTTWRLFIPTIGLTIAGVALDLHFGVKPWCTVVGILLGTALASVLIKQQLNQK